MINKNPLCLFAFLLLGSCATVFSSGLQNISFDSNEKNVEVYINGQKVCETPCVHKVNRSRDTLLVVGRKEGFDETTLTINGGVNLVTLVNLISLPTGATGISTDVTSDKAWEYQPNAFYLTMDKRDDSPVGASIRKKEHKIRAYILGTYPDIKADTYDGGNSSHIKALAEMSGLSVDRVTVLTVQSVSDVELTNAVIKEIKKK